jgi:CSLREA domain-containing protein
LRSRSSLAFGLTFVLPFLFAAAPAPAADYYVNRLTDSASGDCTGDPDDCSLRAAILMANAHAGADVVHLYAGTFELTIAGANEEAGLTGDLDVTGTVTIVGRGPELTIVDANAIDRVFDLDTAGVTLTLRGLTVTGGSDAASGPQFGGGIRAAQGSLSLQSCVVRGNEFVNVNQGSAIYSASGGAEDLTEIVDSWITENSGGIDALCLGTAHIERTTVSGNSSASLWPAVDLFGPDSQVLSSTIGGNIGSGGSGALLVWGTGALIEGCTLSDDNGAALGVASSASATLRNNLIVGFCGGTGSYTTLGGNLESPGQGCHLGANDLDGVPDPLLSTLGSFGGPAPVYQPLAGSPALDAAVAAPGCAAVDERGLSRPRDGDGTGGAVCDIGAVELAGPGEIFVDGFECAFVTGWSIAVL